MIGTSTLLFIVAGSVTLLCLLQWMIYKERRKNRYSPFSEDSLRPPGYALGTKLDTAIDRATDYALGLALTPPFYLLFLSLTNDSVSALFAIAGSVFFIYCAAQFVRSFAEIRVLRLGLDGEMYTGQELNYLMRDGAFVYHDIPYKYGNIDHIIIATGGVFVVETKTVSKPAGDDGQRQYQVTYKAETLHFPRFYTSAAVQQVKRHAEYITTILTKNNFAGIPVIPVIALPGWYVEAQDKKNVLVINPKRGKALRSHIVKNKLANSQVEDIAAHIELCARSVRSSTDKFDPDGNKNYTYWLDRKPEERMLE